MPQPNSEASTKPSAGAGAFVVGALRNLQRTFRESPAFAASVLVTLLFTGVVGTMILLMQIRPGFMGMTHFTEPGHRIHDATYGLIYGTAVFGVFVQLGRPRKNVAGQLMALVPWFALLLAALLSQDVGVVQSTERILGAALTIGATALHPARRQYIRVFQAPRPHWVMLALVAMVAVPLVGFAINNATLQATVNDEHAVMGHYGFMAAFGFTVVGVGLLASLRPAGWRLAAWAAGLLPILFGIASILFPSASSSLAPAWSLAGIVWGIGFVSAAETIRRRDAHAPAVAEPDADAIRASHAKALSPTRVPRWAKLLAIVLVVLLLAGVVWIRGGQHLMGGDASRDHGDHGSNSPPVEGAREAPITANDLSFSPQRVELKAGEPVNVVLTATDTQHDLTVDAADFHIAAARNETIRGGLVFNQPGTYVGYCSVDGHREAGMEMQFIVT